MPIERKRKLNERIDALAARMDQLKAAQDQIKKQKAQLKLQRAQQQVRDASKGSVERCLTRRLRGRIAFPQQYSLKQICPRKGGLFGLRGLAAYTLT